ncbi:MAG: uncharacterized protein A8A55_1935, partial [Amphiamblys sp. WSBS2006]
GKATTKQIRWATKDIVKAILTMLDAFEMTEEDMVAKDAALMRRKIDKAVRAGDWETDRIRHIFTPDVLRKAAVVRLNDMLLVAKNIGEFTKAKEELREATLRSEVKVEANLKKKRKVIPVKKDIEDTRDDIIDSLGRVKSIPDGYAHPIEKNYKRLKKYVMKVPKDR